MVSDAHHETKYPKDYARKGKSFYFFLICYYSLFLTVSSVIRSAGFALSAAVGSSGRDALKGREGIDMQMNSTIAPKDAVLCVSDGSHTRLTGC